VSVATVAPHQPNILKKVETFILSFLWRNLQIQRSPNCIQRPANVCWKLSAHTLAMKPLPGIVACAKDVLFSAPPTGSCILGLLCVVKILFLNVCPLIPLLTAERVFFITF